MFACKRDVMEFVITVTKDYYSNKDIQSKQRFGQYVMNELDNKVDSYTHITITQNKNLDCKFDDSKVDNLFIYLQSKF